jgi:hypothetical protein
MLDDSDRGLDADDFVVERMKDLHLSPVESWNN